MLEGGQDNPSFARPSISRRSFDEVLELRDSDGHIDRVRKSDHVRRASEALCGSNIPDEENIGKGSTGTREAATCALWRVRRVLSTGLHGKAILAIRWSQSNALLRPGRGGRVCEYLRSTTQVKE